MYIDDRFISKGFIDFAMVFNFINVQNVIPINENMGNNMQEVREFILN